MGEEDMGDQVKTKIGRPQIIKKKVEEDIYYNCPETPFIIFTFNPLININL